MVLFLFSQQIELAILMLDYDGEHGLDSCWLIPDPHGYTLHGDSQGHRQIRIGDIVSSV